MSQFDENWGSTTFRSCRAGNLLDPGIYKHYVPYGTTGVADQP